jgi:hypothetical protein
LKAKPVTKSPSSRFEKTFIPDTSAALARSHLIIRIEKGKEIMFMKLCSQIRIDDFKKKRADYQREERRLKRTNKLQSTITE